MRPEEFLNLAKMHPECASMTIPACIQYYDAVEDAAYREFLLDTAKNASLSTGTANALFFAWRETRDEMYEKAILEEGKKAFDVLEDLAEVYKVHPFFMAYDTVYAKKEHYADIVRIFETMDFSDHWNLAALIDVISVMSPEIYEHYRALQDLFRKKIKEAVEHVGGWDRLNEQKPMDRAITGYVILSACANRTLLAEKYEEYALLLWESLKNLPEAWDGSDVALMSMCMELYAKVCKMQRA